MYAVRKQFLVDKEYVPGNRQQLPIKPFIRVNQPSTAVTFHAAIEFRLALQDLGADALILGAVTDGVVLTIRGGKTSREVVAKEVLSFLNTGVVISRAPLAPGASIEIMEIEVLDGAPATEHVLAKLELPHPCLIAAVIRENYVMVPGADDRLAPGDMVVALVERDAVERLLRLFTPPSG